jgi:uncharacterized membrane protein
LVTVTIYYLLVEQVFKIRKDDFMQQEQVHQQKQEQYEGYHQYTPLHDGPWQNTSQQPASFVSTGYMDSTFLRVPGSLAAGLCYIGFWVTGLLFLLFEHRNRLIRFHAMQSLLFFGGVNILYIALISAMEQEIPFVSGFAIFCFVIMNLVACVAWFVGMIGAFSGKYTKLPFVGDFAERYINGDGFVK